MYNVHYCLCCHCLPQALMSNVHTHPATTPQPHPAYKAWPPFQVTVLRVQSLSCVQLFATSWTAACQIPMIMGCFFSGKNTGVGGYFILQGIFLSRDRTQVSYVSCTLPTEPSGKPWPRLNPLPASLAGLTSASHESQLHGL